MSTPRFAASPIAPTASDRAQFADDVAYYLALEPRQLPSKYFYDALGSALFDAICHLPWYPITRAENGLLDAHGADILARIPQLSTLVELGPGNGSKLARLVARFGARRALTLHLVDVSGAALDVAARAVGELDEVTVFRHQASYEAGLAAAMRAGAHAGGRTLALFLGSNIGNFDPPGADALLRSIRVALAPGDAVLVGADLVKPERELVQAYDDPLGVTAAFNRNLLARINRELGGDFDVTGFTHRAVWNAGASRVEMHLVSARSQQARIAHAGLTVSFEAGETIWTESSYKYRPAGIVEMLQRAGFSRLDQWVDSAGGFALTLVEAA
jgi:L-histidine N-alpha-methyltransferase